MGKRSRGADAPAPAEAEDAELLVACWLGPNHFILRDGTIHPTTSFDPQKHISQFTHVNIGDTADKYKSQVPSVSVDYPKLYCGVFDYNWKRDGKPTGIETAKFILYIDEHEKMPCYLHCLLQDEDAVARAVHNIRLTFGCNFKLTLYMYKILSHQKWDVQPATAEEFVEIIDLSELQSLWEEAGPLSVANYDYGGNSAKVRAFIRKAQRACQQNDKQIGLAALNETKAKITDEMIETAASQVEVVSVEPALKKQKTQKKEKKKWLCMACDLEFNGKEQYQLHCQECPRMKSMCDAITNKKLTPEKLLYYGDPNSRPKKQNEWATCVSPKRQKPSRKKKK